MPACKSYLYLLQLCAISEIVTQLVSQPVSNPATDPQLIPPQRHRKFTVIRHQFENVLIKSQLRRCAGAFISGSSSSRVGVGLQNNVMNIYLTGETRFLAVLTMENISILMVILLSDGMFFVTLYLK